MGNERMSHPAAGGSLQILDLLKSYPPGLPISTHSTSRVSVDENIAFLPLGPQKGQHNSRACIHPVLVPTGPRPRSTHSAQKEDLAR